MKHQAIIGKGVESEMDTRVARLPRKGRKSVRLVLVYCGEQDPAVSADGHFDALVSAEQLLGLE